jgi:hypothetical protein
MTMIWWASGTLVAHMAEICTQTPVRHNVLPQVKRYFSAVPPYRHHQLHPLFAIMGNEEQPMMAGQHNMLS